MINKRERTEGYIAEKNNKNIRGYLKIEELQNNDTSEQMVNEIYNKVKSKMK